MAGTNPHYYWDTCIFVAWLKNETTRRPGEMDAILDCLNKFKKREIHLMTSVLTITEITVVKTPAGTDTLLEEVMQRPNFSKVSVDIRVAKLARDMRNYYLVRKTEFGGKTLTVPDSLHLATAILYRADEFHTFDQNNDPKYNSLGLLPLSGNVAGHDLRICAPPIAQQLGLQLPGS